MIRRLLVAVLTMGMCAALAAAPASRAAETYQIDPAHTSIGFAVKHMVINTVHGKFMDFSGAIQLDEQDLTKSSVNITIKTASINTGVEMRDNDLRSPNFFDAAKFPEMSFRSTRVIKQGDGFVAVGDLTMHGVTRQVQIPFTFNGKIKDPWGNWRVGFEGGLTINRQDWGISYNKTLDSGGMVAGNEVKIELNVEATHKI